MLHELGRYWTRDWFLEIHGLGRALRFDPAWRVTAKGPFSGRANQPNRFMKILFILISFLSSVALSGV
ncbi:MAG: hypothetical protein ACREUU_11690, partial [Gammaproteobacteria bacterium]